MRLNRVAHLPTSGMKEERAVVEEAPHKGEGLLWVPSLPHLCQALTTSAHHVKSETGSVRELADMAAYVWNVGPSDSSEALASPGTERTNESGGSGLVWQEGLMALPWNYYGPTPPRAHLGPTLLPSGGSDPSVLSSVGRFAPWERLRAQSFRRLSFQLAQTSSHPRDWLGWHTFGQGCATEIQLSCSCFLMGT